MNFQLLGVLFEDFPVLRHGFVPIPLCFKCLGFEFFRLRRTWSHGRKFLGCTGGKLRIEVSESVEDLGIAGKFALQQQQSLSCSLALIKAHSAASRQHRGFVLCRLTRGARHSLPQQRQRLPASASVSKFYASFGGK